MRKSEGKKVGLSLINGRPDNPADEGEPGERRVWQVNNAKQKCDKKDTFPGFAGNHLRSSIDVTLQRVLLKQRPERHQQKPPTKWTDNKRLVRQKSRDKNDQNHGDDRRHEQ